MKKIVLGILTVAVLLLSFTGCGKSDVINITHKNYTEQRLLGQMMSVYLESKGYNTNVTELGGTMLCYNALKNGNVDLYAEYTGSAYGAIYDQTENLETEALFQEVKTLAIADGITWLNPFGFNNTYSLCVTEATAENIESISDLAAYSSDFKLAADIEFLNRQDGIIGLKEAYPTLAFSEEISMDQGLTYGVLKDGEVDVISSFSTDGRIEKFNLVNLIDDQNFFLPYYVTPTLRTDYAEANPELVTALEELGDSWTDIEMQGYNLQVDEGAKTIDVATQMLEDKGLI